MARWRADGGRKMAGGDSGRLKPRLKDLRSRSGHEVRLRGLSRIQNQTPPDEVSGWGASLQPAQAGFVAAGPSGAVLTASSPAALIVIGSYFLAQYFKVWRPRRLGQAPARRPEAPPQPAFREAVAHQS